MSGNSVKWITMNLSDDKVRIRIYFKIDIEWMKFKFYLVILLCTTVSGQKSYNSPCKTASTFYEIRSLVKCKHIFMLSLINISALLWYTSLLIFLFFIITESYINFHELRDKPQSVTNGSLLHRKTQRKGTTTDHNHRIAVPKLASKRLGWKCSRPETAD